MQSSSFEEDFDVKADWHLYAKNAHGKRAYDGIGAILKRKPIYASLQTLPTIAILTPELL